MKLLCQNNRTKVYVDNGFYIVKTIKKEFKVSIQEQPAYPLACCLKWGMKPVDIDYLNKLSDDLK